MQPGEGMGIGMLRRGLGGFEYCRCPRCGYSQTHDMMIPCNRIRCPICGAYLIGD